MHCRIERHCQIVSLGKGTSEGWRSTEKRDLVWKIPKKDQFQAEVGLKAHHWRKV